jgi:hypothetical protein
MAADYDAPRVNEDEAGVDTLVLERTGLHAPTIRDDSDGGLADIDSESWDNRDAEIIVIPLQATEFVCTGCFLMVSRLQLSPDHSHGTLCNDCAA